MKLNRVLFLMALAVGSFSASVAHAVSITVATFDDPALNSTTPLFTYSQGTGTQAAPAGSTLSAAWTDPSLDLIFAPTATTFTDAEFSFSGLVSDGGFSSGVGSLISFGPGSFTFYEDGGVTPILTYSWADATLTDSGFGGSLAANGVVITAPAGSDLFGWTFAPLMTFNFSFANPGGGLGQSIFGTLGGGPASTWTAAFTSSGENVEFDTPVPEPGSMLLLGTGLMGLAASARRRMRMRRKD